MTLTTEFIAHRGSSFVAPENTLAAFALGWQETTTCECDIIATRDGRLLVIHDDSTRRTTGVDLLVAEHSLAELQRLDAGSWKGAEWRGEKLPALAEVLAAMPDGKRLLIESKAGAEVMAELAEVVRASGREGDVVVQSFYRATCDAARQILPRVPIILLLACKRAAADQPLLPTMAEAISMALAGGFHGIGVNDTDLITHEAVVAIHAAGLRVNIWTIDDPAAAKRLVELGVDGLITNRPGWLRVRLG